MKRTLRHVLVLIATALTSAAAFAAQPPQPPSGPPPAPRVMAPVDFTGVWVSVVSEDWRWRMMRPAKGDYTSIPLSAAGRAAADTWEPMRDQGDACRSYAAPTIMRIPGRVRISWQDDYTLKIETDAGTQTRVLQFARPDAPPLSVSAGAPRTWQGFSVARWEPQGRAVTGGGFLARGPAPPTTRTLEVTTNHLRAGYLRKNGVPFSENTVVMEYFNTWKATTGEWFTVTTIVQDPVNLRQPFVTTTDFRKEPNDAKWDPTPCQN